MRTYIGVDYHRGYSYMTAMDEEGRICGRGRVANHPEALREFLRRAGVDGRSAGGY